MAYLDENGVETLASEIKSYADGTYPKTESIASEYDSTASYAVGDYCLKNGLLYKCNTAIATGGEIWNSSHWTLTKVSDEFGSGGGNVINENILQNWYFIGGGSHQGNGQFPINQRANTSYSGSVWCIDRWSVNCSSFDFNSDYISITYTNYANREFKQVVENGGAKYAGKTLTFTVLLAETTSEQLILSLKYTGASSSLEETVSFTTDVLGSATFQIPSEASGNLKVTIANTTTNGATVKFKAVKLEVGDTQTLAAKVNGSWVINEIPNYIEELLKVSRYLVPRVGPGSAGWLSTDGKATIFIPTPIEMSKVPSLSSKTNGAIVVGTEEVSVSAASATSVVANGVFVELTTSKTNVTAPCVAKTFQAHLWADNSD